MSRVRTRAVGALLAFAALGCAKLVTLAEPPTPLDARQEALPAPLVIEWIESRRAGVEIDLPAERIARCAEALRSVSSFSEVYEPRRAHAAPPDAFTLWMRVDEEFDLHPGARGTKLAMTIVTGAWIGLVIPYYYDDRVTIEGEVLAPDGRVHRYRVERSGTIRSSLLGLANADHELSERVLDDALRAFAAAIASDATLGGGTAAEGRSP